MFKHTCPTKPKMPFIAGSHMQDGKRKDSKGLLYGKLKKGTRKTGCPLLRFKDVCKRDTKSAAIDIESLELMVKNCSIWRHLVKEGIKHAEIS